MADSRTQIKAKLTPEGSAILGGLEWAILDLAPNFSPRISKDVNMLSELNKLKTDGFLEFSVPFSTTNDAAFIKMSSPIITDNKDEGIEARISVDGHELDFDRIWVKRKTHTAKTWDIEVRRSPNHWVELASEKKLCTIDCGDVTLEAGTVSDGWANQLFTDGEAVERWVPADYGGWVDLAEPAQFTDPPVKQVWLEDLRPLLSKVYLLKQGFCEIGWTLDGQILEAAYIRAQFDYVLAPDYYTHSKGGLHKLIGQETPSDINANDLIPTPIVFEDLQYDPGGNAVLISAGVWAGGIVNNLPFKSRYRFKLSATIENTMGSALTISVGIGEYDGTLPDFLTGLMFYDTVLSLGANEIRRINIDQEIDLEVGQTATFVVGPSGFGNLVKLKKGYRVIIEPANKSLVRGDLVTLKSLINCDLYLLDYLKGFIHEIGGRLETDTANRTVTVHPYRTTDVAGNSVPGFIQDGEPAIDLDGLVICDSEQLTRVKSDLLRYTRLAFADSTDAWVESLKLPDPPYSRKVLNSIELPDEIQELKNPFFEPTLEGRPDTLRRRIDALEVTRPMAYFPRMWDNTDGERSFKIGPRTFMFYGDVGQLDEEKNDLTYFYFEGAFISHFGYASQKPTLPHHPTFPPTLDGTVVYGTEDSDLYVTFHLAALQRQKRGLYLELLAMIDQGQYNTWNFRVPFRYTYNGRPIRMEGERISDFAPALDLSTPMRLLVYPADTQCCDLPCSCSFTECDYYQDFGQYMTQETLDELSVTSFKINEIEQLEAAVGFGIINIVELAGKQFVTNLIDTLNDLGIDYFSFRASTKDYPEKEDQRFFKIKRPTCWSFEIIISDGDGEVYRYRDFDMAQKWFDADWEAMGYGANPVSEPQDCTTTTEY